MDDFIGEDPKQLLHGFDQQLPMNDFSQLSSEDAQVRGTKNYTVVLEFFVKTIRINMSLN